MPAIMYNCTPRAASPNGLNSSFAEDMGSLARHSVCRQRGDILSLAEKEMENRSTAPLPISPSWQCSPMSTPQISMKMEAIRKAVGHSRNLASMSQASADATVPYKLHSTSRLSYWVGKDMVWLDFHGSEDPLLPSNECAECSKLLFIWTTLPAYISYVC